MVPLGCCSSASALPPFLGFFTGLGISQKHSNQILRFFTAGEIVTGWFTSLAPHWTVKALISSNWNGYHQERDAVSLLILNTARENLQ
jgi:hypothetical protein